MHHVRRICQALATCILASSLAAQTFVGNLDGAHVNSTLELNSTFSLPTLGWTVVSGTPRVFDSANDAIINGNGLNHNPFGVRYVTSESLVANSTYTLSFRMGYFSGPYAGSATANYQFSLGTWNGSVFTPLQSASGGPVSYNGQFSTDGSFGVTATLNYVTGSSVPADVIAIEWAQTNTSANHDFFGFDNATLSYTASAIPEPSTYAALLGASTLGFTVWRRRRRRRPASDLA